MTVPTPDVDRLAGFTNWVLMMHQPRVEAAGTRPRWCTCGVYLVACAYRAASVRYLGVPP